MSVADKIIKEVCKLPEEKQVEVLDFVEYLRGKEERQAKKEWTDYSLSSSMHGMEDEPSPYTMSDIKETFS